MSFKKLLIKWFNITYKDIDIPSNLTTVKLVEDKRDVVEISSNYQIDTRSFNQMGKNEVFNFIKRELALGIGNELLKSNLVKTEEVEIVGPDFLPVKKYMVTAKVIKPKTK